MFTWTIVDVICVLKSDWKASGRWHDCVHVDLWTLGSSHTWTTVHSAYLFSTFILYEFIKLIISYLRLTMGLRYILNIFCIKLIHSGILMCEALSPCTSANHKCPNAQELSSFTLQTRNVAKTLTESMSEWGRLTQFPLTIYSQSRMEFVVPYWL